MVTGTGGGGFGEQIVKALKLSKATKYKLICTDITPFSTGAVLGDSFYVLPRATESTYLDGLLKICQENGVQALFPGSESELLVMAKHRHIFQELGIFLPINTEKVLDLCMDKNKLSVALSRLGFRVPISTRIDSTEALDKFAIYPMVLKPSSGSGGSSDVFIAQSEQEKNWYGNYLLNNYREFIAQEYVGTPEEEYTVGVLLDMDGVLINSIVLKRQITSSMSTRINIPNKTNRYELGSRLVISSGISQGEIANYAHIARSCEEIALAINACASINIQCRVIDGQVYIFEINPRFSGTTSLRALVGYNEPDVLIRKYLLDEEVMPHFNYDGGLILRRLQEEIIYLKEI